MKAGSYSREQQPQQYAPPTVKVAEHLPTLVERICSLELLAAQQAEQIYELQKDLETTKNFVFGKIKEVGL